MAKKCTCTVRSLQLIIQYLRERIATDFWFRFQIKALENNTTEGVSDFRFTYCSSLQNSKHPLLCPTMFLPNIASWKKMVIKKYISCERDSREYNNYFYLINTPTDAHIFI